MILRPAVLVAGALLFVLIPAHEGSAAPGDGEDVLDLHVAVWDAAAYSHRVSGPLGWLRGPDGSLRLELGAEGPDADPRTLLERSGDGWTLILGPEGEGTLNAWGREWRRVDPGLASLAREAVAFFDRTGAEAERRRLVVPDLGEGDRPADQAASLRRELVRRGRGRGGRGEIIVLERFAPGDPAGAFEIRSTRRPGRIRVGVPSTRPLVCPIPEVFLPLWPLDEITRPAPENSLRNPGTSPSGEG
jgi:hypothetical protein